MLFFDLIYNLLSLTAFCIFSGFIDARFRRNTLKGQLFQGMLFGLIVLIGMTFPFTYAEGIIFDGRSIVISTATLFFGPVAGSVPFVFALLYRTFLGGSGLAMGVTVITSAFMIGWLFNHLKSEGRLNTKTFHLFLFGMTVHTAMWLCLFLLPRSARKESFEILSLSILGVYPLITILIGKILSDQENSIRSGDLIKQKEALFRATFNESIVGMCINSLQDGRFFDANESFLKATGFSREELIGKTAHGTGLLRHDKEMRKIARRLLTGKSVYGKSLTFKTKEKELRHISISSSLITIKDKKYVLSSVVDMTDQKRSVEALAKREKQFSELFQRNAAVKLLIDPLSREILDANDAAVDFYGWSRDELLRMKISEINTLSPEEVANAIKTLQKNKIQHFEFKHRRADGTIKDVDVYASLVKMNDRDIIHSIIHDITARKETEKMHHIQYRVAHALVNSGNLRELFSTVREELSSVMDTSNFVIALYDEQTNMLHAPFEVDENHDVPPAWSSEKSLTGYVVRTNKTLLLDKRGTQELAEKEGIQVLGTRSECWLGVPLHTSTKVIGAIIVQSYSDPRAYDRKKADLLDAVANQISNYIERKRSEEETLKLTKAMSQSPVTIVITDIHGTIEYVNPKFTEITGYSFHEAIGQNPKVLKSGRHSNEFYKDLWETILSGNEWQGEFINRKKNGEEYLEKAIISPITDCNGKLTHFMAIKEDITEKKKLIDELILAKEQSEISDKLKTAFLQNMSHEIRTPLNGMIGFAYLLSKTQNDPEKIKEYASIILSSGNRLMELLNNVIDISKIEAGIVDLTLKDIQVHKMLNNVLIQFRSITDPKNIQLITPGKYIDNELIIRSDEQKLMQILTNLVDNAVKFTPSGKIEVGYAVGEKEIVFCVSDTGIGISVLQQSSIFERFYQADMSFSRGFEGSGLGLPICKGLVEQLSGRIWIESLLEKGTKVYFSIPLELSPVKTKEAEEYNTDEISHDFSTILIAEDDEFSYTFLETLLEHSSLRIIRAFTGTAAVRYCKDHPEIELVLMDIKMPEMDGLEATRQIKRLRPDLPVIAQTAYAFEHEMEAALKAGCDEYLTKPIAPEKLFASLAKWTTAGCVNLDGGMAQK